VTTPQRHQAINHLRREAASLYAQAKAWTAQATNSTGSYAVERYAMAEELTQRAESLDAAANWLEVTA